LGLPVGESYSAARLASLDKKAKKEIVKPSSDGILAGRILASGGIRTGRDLAASLILGARLAGTALPFIRALQTGGLEAAQSYVADMRAVLERVMVLTDCATIAQLRASPWRLAPALDQEVRDYMQLFG
jgi:isopentenyl diphosphate isomerase/L-lactate dehydrogenase-like FMN-dependent dehydrogenase